MLKEFVSRYCEDSGKKVSEVRKALSLAIYPEDEYFNRNNKFGQLFNGNYQLKAYHVTLICDTLEISPDYFFGRQKPEPKLALNEEKYNELCTLLNIEQ